MNVKEINLLDPRRKKWHRRKPRNDLEMFDSRNRRYEYCKKRERALIKQNG